MITASAAVSPRSDHFPIPQQLHDPHVAPLKPRTLGTSQNECEPSCVSQSDSSGEQLQVIVQMTTGDRLRLTYMVRPQITPLHVFKSGGSVGNCENPIRGLQESLIIIPFVVFS